jgi:hypothetical protein
VLLDGLKMRSWSSIPLGLVLAAGLTSAAFFAGKPSRARTATAPSAASAAAVAVTHAPEPPQTEQPVLDLLLEEPAPELSLDAGSSPDLPTGAPKSVSFGVVLYHYAGAQMAPAGARSREEALKLAESAAAEAQKDFGKAVQQGDSGSTEDAGVIPRGVLEPSVEYVLFTMKKGEVHEKPLETPRGFWILRRNE